MRRLPLAVPSVAVAAVLVLAGCTSKDPAPAPSATGSRATAPSPSAADGTVTTEAKHLGAPVRIAVHPIQADGQRALLTVDFAMAKDAPPDASISLGVLLRDPGSFLNAGKLRLLDLSSSTVYDVARDSTNRAVTSQGPQNLTPGTTVTVHAYFAAPTASHVDVLLPYFGLVAGVPVTTVGAGGTSPTPPADLHADGQVTYPSAALDAFTVGYDSSSSGRVEGRTATVTLASDVLFATGEYVLTPQAAAVVDRAAQQVLASGKVGEVSVTGHTDDVGTDAFNQDLSEKRAQSVADRLAPILGGSYTLTVAGKGKTQPVAPGTSPEARAANRRVEIAFTTKDAGAAVDVPSGVPAPAATGPVGSGSTPVSLQVDGVSYTVAATSVVRREGYLVGTLEVTRTSSGTGPLTGLFGDAAIGLSLGRGLPATTLAGGAFNVSLLGQGSRLYPADYVTKAGQDGAKDRRAVVADEFLDASVAAGQSVAVTVVWPNLAGGTVSIDVPDRFRITDVPVSGS